MKVKIEVTQADIDSGTPDCPCTCPVALALERAVGPCDDVFVSKKWIMRFRQENIVWSADTPDEVADFINHFDVNGTASTEGWAPQPFTCDAEFSVYRRVNHYEPA